MDGNGHPLQFSAQILAKQFDLPLNLVLAIITATSGGDVHAWKPGTRHPNEAALPTPLGLVSKWGPMLVLGSDAAALGFTGSFPKLCDSHLGVEYGCRQLAKLRDEYAGHRHQWSMVVAAYDFGSPRCSGGGGFINQSFVNAVAIYGGFEGLANV